MIYLASPYSHKNEKVMEHRFLAVCRKASQLMREGKIVFSPIAHTHPIAQFGLPKGWEYWREFDKFFLSVSEELYVYKLEGWQISTGVTGEIFLAKDLCIPITYLEAGE